MTSNKEIERAIEGLGSGWELKEDKILKSFQFPSFMKAIECVNDIAKIAEGGSNITRLLQLTGGLSNFP